MEDEPIYEDHSDKLRRLCKQFEDALDHHAKAHAEAHRCSRFYHNTHNEGQWEEEDLEYLRANLRPAYTFNIIAPKTNTMLGMYADSQRTPRVRGSGAEDELLAEVIDIVSQQIFEQAKGERLSARMKKTAAVMGECDMHVEVVPNHEGPGWIRINLYRILPFEVHWDMASVEADRSDARHVFWDRWLSEDQFKAAYPEHASEWESFELKAGPDSGQSLFEHSSGEPSIDFQDGDMKDYGEGGLTHHYYNRHKHKIRVIRCEYKEFETRFYVTDEMTGQRAPLTEDQLPRVEMAIDLGETRYSIDESKEEVVRVCEFVGSGILREYPSAGPFDGFSIVPAIYAVDEETGTAYGFVRNLMDPQMEMNKAKSLEIEHMAQRVNTGAITEEDSVSDKEQFQRELRRPGGNPEVKKGVIAEGRIMLTQPEGTDPAAQARAQGAAGLLAEISGIPDQTNRPASEYAQAGVTMAIRYQKSKQTVSEPFGNLEDADKQVRKLIAEAVTRAMPDSQIESILSATGHYAVRDGIVVELMPDPQGSGQMVPGQRADLRNLGQMKWDLELEHSTQNQTLRMIELDVLMQLIQAGMPVPSDMVADRVASTRSDREKLETHFKQVEQANAQAQQMQAQAFAEQQAAALQLEAGKLAETKRHNQVGEIQAQVKTIGDQRIDLLELWEKADEAEKARLVQYLAPYMGPGPTPPL